MERTLGNFRRQRELGDKRGIAYSLENLGNLSDRQADYARAVNLYQESLMLLREFDDKFGIAALLNNLGWWCT